MDELEAKLKAVLEGVSSRFSEGELPDTEYNALLFDLFKSQGILSGDFDYKNAWRVGTLRAKVDRKLSVKKLWGLNDDYHAMQGTPVSAEARQDIEKYDALVKMTRAHFQEVVGQRQVYQDEFYELLTGYVTSQTPGLKDFRRAAIIVSLSAIFRRDINIQERPVKIGSYELATIEGTLAKL